MGGEVDRFRRIEPPWCELNEAMIVTSRSLDPVVQWPWRSSHPRVRAAWEALTQPENLPELEAWMGRFDGGAAMHAWAAAATRKAVEVGRSRATHEPKRATSAAEALCSNLMLGRGVSSYGRRQVMRQAQHLIPAHARI